MIIYLWVWVLILNHAKFIMWVYKRSKFRNCVLVDCDNTASYLMAKFNIFIHHHKLTSSWMDEFLCSTQCKVHTVSTKDSCLWTHCVLIDYSIGYFFNDDQNNCSTTVTKYYKLSHIFFFTSVTTAYMIKFMNFFLVFKTASQNKAMTIETCKIKLFMISNMCLSLA